MAKHSRNIFNDKRFFYIALAVCMLALGSASASMLKSYRTVQMQEDTSSSDYSGNGAQRTGEAVENLPYSEADEQGIAAGKSDGSAENGSQNLSLIHILSGGNVAFDAAAADLHGGSNL